MANSAANRYLVVAVMWTLLNLCNYGVLSSKRKKNYGVLSAYNRRHVDDGIMNPILIFDEEQIRNIDWDAEIRMLYLHTGRGPATLVIQSAEAAGFLRHRGISFNGGPFHGQAIITIIERLPDRQAAAL